MEEETSWLAPCDQYTYRFQVCALFTVVIAVVVVVAAVVVIADVVLPLFVKRECMYVFMCVYVRECVFVCTVHVQNMFIFAHIHPSTLLPFTLLFFLSCPALLVCLSVSPGSFFSFPFLPPLVIFFTF